MKASVFYIYLALLNGLWIFSILIALAGGHGLRLKNPQVQSLLFIAGVALANTFFLLLKSEKRGIARLVVKQFFLIATLGVLCWLFYGLFKVGTESFLINIPVFLLLLFLFGYTIYLIIFFYRKRH